MENGFISGESIAKLLSLQSLQIGAPNSGSVSNCTYEYIKYYKQTD